VNNTSPPCPYPKKQTNIHTNIQTNKQTYKQEKAKINQLGFEYHTSERIEENDNLINNK
jgi:hypothetical protein